MHAPANAAPTLDGLDDHIEGVLRDWEVPGLAITIVHEAGRGLVKGYGLREIGGTDPVTPDTVFTIGSLTKAFTAAAIGLLVDEGRIGWDDPVQYHLKGFELADPYASRITTIRDLLAHRVGWEEDYWGHFANRLDLSRQEIIQSLRFADSGAAFRARHVYSNILYLVAGEIIPAVTGHSWDDFVKDRIFGPLGMNSTSTRAAALAASQNHATPHTRDSRGRQRIDPIRFDAWWTMDNHGPAGSINSTARDMSIWLRAYCEPTGSPFSKSVLHEMHSPQMLINDEDEDDANITRGYGLGWRIGLYHGHPYSYHEGAFRGMSAYAALLPESGSGVAVLANARDAVEGRLTRAVGQWVLDHILGAPERDWQREYRQSFLAAIEVQATTERAWASMRAQNTGPSLPLSRYVGRYHHPAFAPWEVVAQHDRLIARRLRGGEAYSGVLDHWHHDTFMTIWNDPLVDYWPARFISFSLDSAGLVEAFRFSHEPGRTGTRFKKEA